MLSSTLRWFVRLYSLNRYCITMLCEVLLVLDYSLLIVVKRLSFIAVPFSTLPLRIYFIVYHEWWCKTHLNFLKKVTALRTTMSNRPKKAVYKTSFVKYCIRVKMITVHSIKLGVRVLIARLYEGTAEADRNSYFLFTTM